jgi:hypothetical protein
MVSVPVGGFADPSFAEPGASAYEERRHPWMSFATRGPLERMP